MVVEGTGRYTVGAMVADAGVYRLYLCTQEITGRQCLLQIATVVAHNGKLDRAAYVLTELKHHADELEAAYARTRTDPDNLLNYDLGFPELVESFLSPDQGGRRINILAFRNVDNVSSMVPIGNITERDRRRVDLRTSAWIMGKLLKLLVFTPSLGIVNRRINGANILIEPNEHYVVLFDWSDARTFSKEVPADIRRAEIAQAAQAVITVLGGDVATGVIPDDGHEAYGRYTEHLLRLARGGERDAKRAHTQFYELIDELWERAFYPFTSLPLGS